MSNFITTLNKRRKVFVENRSCYQEMSSEIDNVLEDVYFKIMGKHEVLRKQYVFLKIFMTTNEISVDFNNKLLFKKAIEIPVKDHIKFFKGSFILPSS